MRFRLIGLAVVLLFAGCSAEQGPREWRFALEEIEGSVQYAYAKKFKSLVEQRSGGEVKVSIYPYGALGTSAQITELVQSGGVQFAFASPGHLGSVIPEAQLFSLHFLFPDDARQAHQVLTADSPFRDLLAEAYREKRLELLSLVSEGWMVWTGDRPLRTLSDFNGFKIRTMVSPLLLEAYRAYGANPTPMPYAEVYGALQLNMIDGQVNPVFAIEEMSFYEVQKAMTFANHLPFVSSVVTGPEFLAGLAESERQMLRSVIEELEDYVFEVQERYNRERLDRIRQASAIELVTLTEQERDAFRQASLPVRRSYIEATGPRGERILKALLRERDRIEGSLP